MARPASMRECWRFTAAASSRFLRARSSTSSRFLVVRFRFSRALRTTAHGSSRSSNGFWI